VELFEAALGGLWFAVGSESLRPRLLRSYEVHPMYVIRIAESNRTCRGTKPRQWKKWRLKKILLSILCFLLLLLPFCPIDTLLFPNNTTPISSCLTPFSSSYISVYSCSDIKIKYVDLKTYKSCMFSITYD